MASPRSPLPSIRIEVSPGELLDRISILEIKAERIEDPAKLKNIRHELGLYRDIRQSLIPGGAAIEALIRDLKAVNEILWEVEDEIRACEANRDFGSGFVELARSVYRTNDRRAAIKREINTLCGSSIIEEKSYTEY
ncbi:MAG: DUF6165 family protein [Alphaproteobacteria bacterium]